MNECKPLAVGRVQTRAEIKRATAVQTKLTRLRKRKAGVPFAWVAGQAGAAGEAAAAAAASGPAGEAAETALLAEARSDKLFSRCDPPHHNSSSLDPPHHNSSSLELDIIARRGGHYVLGSRRRRRQSRRRCGRKPGGVRYIPPVTLFHSVTQHHPPHVNPRSRANLHRMTSQSMMHMTLQRGWRWRRTWRRPRRRCATCGARTGTARPSWGPTCGRGTPSTGRQGLTLVHFSAQPEPFLTLNTPK